MFAGIDFPSHFDKDNFVERRSVGNLWDPEAFISGSELEQGYNFTNSSRMWKSEAHYLHAINGGMTPEQVLIDAPRRFRSVADEYIATGIMEDTTSLLSEDIV